MYLLDTDHITLLARSGEEGERIRQRVLLAPEGEVSASIVSYEEQMRGWLAQLNRISAVNQQAIYYTRLEENLRFYNQIPLISFDTAVVEQFQALWVQRIRIGTMDLKIAATALAHDATLLTRNAKDFSKVPGLRLEDWSIGLPE
ncbi:type II toxin-antitoxin system VapC family toxin [Armatimonas rosea]|uniref:tRNA(fMet)-specific endonuclease VapC n=1 Tax=Armatimonas rosea TaxID=685828 RepID=A0A7W9STI5_ARMRO|nr:type II toxin-antitoxin system VapC family toxin [Armatimonas rosea]MBB6051748.1 tRNA(fMet)-specific endonuclease VapC [Armatimonas rosea]